jgi:hypothetical protein
VTRAALGLLGVAILLLAGCGSGTRSLTDVSFRNDLSQLVRVGTCADTACHVVAAWVSVAAGKVATTRIAAADATRRYVVVASPDKVLGCVVLRLSRDNAPVTVRLSTATGCGSGG